MGITPAGIAKSNRSRNAAVTERPTAIRWHARSSQTSMFRWFFISTFRWSPAASRALTATVAVCSRGATNLTRLELSTISRTFWATYCDLVDGHRGIQGQGDNPRIQIEGARTGALRQGQPAEEAKQRNRDEVHAGADASLLQLANELAAVDLEPAQIEPEDVEVPRMTAAGIVGRRLHFLHAGECVIVHTGV